MSIKLRLVLSNIAMITVPIILFFFASLLLVVFFLGDFRKMAEFLPESHNYHKKTVQEDSVVFLELKKKSVADPEELMSIGYLQSLNERLKGIEAGLIIRKNNEIFYSTAELEKVKAPQLPKFGVETSYRNLESIGNQTFAIKQHDFFLQDGSQISFFLYERCQPME